MAREKADNRAGMWMGEEANIVLKWQDLIL